MSKLSKYLVGYLFPKLLRNNQIAISVERALSFVRCVPCSNVLKSRTASGSKTVTSVKLFQQTECSSVKKEESPVCECKTGIKIQILAKPGAKTNSVTDIGTEVGIQIAAPPVDGEANTELVKYLSKVLDLKKSRINLDKGSRSRNKTVIVTDSTTEYILLRLQEEMARS